MAIHIIIDGYNLIRRSSFFSEFDRQDPLFGRQALIDALSAYKSVRPHKITVVFDGTRRFGNSRQRDQIKGINIVFSRNGEEADHVIKQLAGREKERALVVSSDQDIVRYAEGCGASVTGTSAFEEKIVMAGMSDSAEMPTDAESYGWIPTTRKKGPRRRLSRKKRRHQRQMGKL